MAKLGSINFDNRILDAARNGTLVVFAGAGVSMGPPSNLPSFQVLAECIANGTGVAVGEPLDRFLGHLQGRGIPVHERAAKQLSVPESQPKQLHQDLLKIFGTVDRVRIVTTNFDSHFESASIAAFGKEPDLYRAPALPRGSDFNGIIHVHGALSHPADLVLTDADFGRAYLTEGWARRFLVEVFRRYTVLFVGYSHDDVVMNYLSRALPADGVVGRFALTEKEGNWKILGITPIRFELAETGNSYKALEDGVHKLVELASRGVLDWRQRLTDLGTGAPPVDDEVVDEIEEGLREVHTTRFLLRAANGAEWLRWFDARHHFDALFGPGALSERESMLMNWLVSNFALKQPYEVFRLIALHGGRLSTALWSAFVLQIGTDKEVPLEASVLAKWVTILLATRPPATDRTNLVWLAERCADAGENTLTLKIFLYLCQHETTLTATSSNWNIVDEDEAPHRRFEAACVLGCDVNLLSDLWTDHVKPNLPVIALPLLSGITKILEDIQRDLATWDMVSDGWDPHSYHRSAIERHEQDRFPEPIDVLIDAARDALEHMVESHPLFVEAWIENVNVEVSLLRRLAVHASTVLTTTSADERLNWILRRVGLEGTMEHHEVYRATAISYPLASDDMRRTLVDAVLAIKVPAAVDWSAEKMTDWSRFAWLSWLLQARPDCIYAQAALEPIKQRHPEWELEEHPDFTHYSGMTGYAGNESPWPTEQLLAKSAQDQLDQLLTYEGARLFGPSRSGLLMAVTAACKRNPQWAFGLIVALIAKGAYSSDLLAAALRGFNDSELTADEWHELLTIAGKQEIQAAHGTDIARLLVGLVKDGGKPFALDLLDKANEVALGTWQSERHDETDQQVSDWLATAINRSSGIIVEYWLASLAVLMHGKSGDERFLPSAYKSWFESVLIEPGPKGGYGRALLASQIAFLSGMDDVWTREQVLPLFTDSDSSRFAQAWHGFLAWGQLNQTLAAEMLPGFRAALSRMKNKAPRRRRFVEFYAAIAVFYADDPMQNLLPDLMHLGAVNDRVTFAGCIGNFLRTMETGAKRALWDRWLKRYWELRLDGTDAPLDEGEIEKMLNWLAYLDDSFVEGVALAVQAPHVVLDHSSLLLELRKNELVVQFPEAVAQLLIYLCDCVRSYFIADLATIANRLPPLPLEVDRRLKEQMARVGAI